MSDILLSSLVGLDSVGRLCESKRAAPYPSVLHGLPLSVQGLIGAAIAHQLNQTAIFVAPGEGEAEKIADSLRGVFSENEVAVLPAKDLVFDAMDAAAADAAFARLRVLGGCLSGEIRMVVTTADGYATLCPDPQELLRQKSSFRVGQTVEMGDLIAFLEDNGYNRQDMVEGAGSYAVRGSIVDVYPPEQPSPIRIDFFDNEIDGIGRFDVVSQRRSEQLQEVSIGAAGANFDRHRRDKALAEMIEKRLAHIKDPMAKEKAEKDVDMLRSGLGISGRDRYLPMEMGEHRITDFLPQSLLFVCEWGGMRERFEFLKWQFEEDSKRMVEQRLPFFPKERYYFSFEDFVQIIGEQKAIFLSQLPLSGYFGKLSFLEEISVRQDAVARNDHDMMREEIAQALKDRSVFFCTGGGDSAAKMMNFLELPFGTQVQKGTVCLVPDSLMLDCEIGHQILLLGDKVLKKSAPRRVRHRLGEKIRSFADIAPGDLVVHVHHGIGVYRGIRQVDNHGVVKDYLTIGYDKGDTLYVPTNQLDLIAKYMGTAEDTKVKLSRLGSGAWEKTKAKARNQTKILAKELIELYARRQKAPGFAFSKDSDWQRQFEDNFAYAETDDQIRCIDEIKADMEKPCPMDRLLCGDVGFGKTEVALRAIFKAVNDSKQAAVLVPTTILSEQHLKTIAARLRGFPIKVQVINRFKKTKQQQEILRQLRRGEIDIIVGTHRLLQKDVVFKDLGLLVVDEEQRFGVKHKEAIKQMSIGVDVLTLSATPIPRTLNMALSGIRDMSIIEEAPADRYPVATYVLEYDEGVVMGAIRREMRRHGCVYYLKNDIESLDHIAAHISEEIPAARVAVAHGQMKGEELESIWQQVLDREIDVLLCTTIIETGVDVSFANTLIIEDADHMGLAQLHQIRGRIGRSNIRAYAYLTYRIGKQPSEIATKRLMTIKEFTAFGSGLKIAMRDLEIRGAGSVLGERQHGHLNTVGYDLYMRLLSEAVAEEQGSEVPSKSDCQMDIAVSAFLSSDYVEREESRIDLYKKIAAIENREDLADITDELCDRFGDPPKEAVDLMRIALLRGTARVCGVSEIKQKGTTVLIFLERGDPERLFAAVNDFKGRLRLSNAARPYLTLYLTDGDIIDQMQAVIDYIGKK
ncbi:MAG: transcription-repair coupling factor [Clostridia bacterium]|nr:transcription-repair coupling factor [Clostridia bacterium]